MSENILSAALTFSLLAGGTLAIGSEMLTPRQAPRQAAAVVLPRVSVVALRDSAPAVVTLPRVSVEARRLWPTDVAVETRDSQAPRVE